MKLNEGEDTVKIEKLQESYAKLNNDKETGV